MTDAKTLVARLRARAFGPSSQHQVGDFTIATADMTLKDEDCAKAADAIEELTAALRDDVDTLNYITLVLKETGCTATARLAAERSVRVRVFATKYGASND